MSELAVRHESNEVAGYDPTEVARYLGLNPNNPADRAMVAVCQRYDFDPVLKHVVVIPKGGVYVTRDGLLHVAHRSGQLDGIVVEQDPTLDRDAAEWVAKVSVYRKDMSHPFTFPGRYPVNGGNKQYAQEMALKAAEAHALRRAFDVTGLPAFDEQRPEPAPAQQVGGLAAALQTSGAEGVPDEAVAAPVEHVSTSAPESDTAPPKKRAAKKKADTEPADEPWQTDLTDNTRKRLFALFNERGITDRDEQIRGIVHIIGRPIASRSELMEADALAVIARLAGGQS